MCLGIPGQVMELLSHEHLARVDVAGVGRIINIGLLVEDHQPVGPGDWVLIHVGFAMSKIDEEEASMAMSSLQMMGQEYTDEMTAMESSTVTTNTGG